MCAKFYQDWGIHAFRFKEEFPLSKNWEVDGADFKSASSWRPKKFLS